MVSTRSLRFSTVPDETDPVLAVHAGKVDLARVLQLLGAVLSPILVVVTPGDLVGTYPLPPPVPQLSSRLMAVFSVGENCNWIVVGPSGGEDTDTAPSDCSMR